VKCCLRALLCTLAAASLLLSLTLVAVWLSHLLPLRYWVRSSLRPLDNPRRSLEIAPGNNILFFQFIRFDDRPTPGPLASDKSASAAFQKQFPPPTYRVSALRFKTARECVFRTSADGRVTMAGTLTSFGIPYFLLVFAFLLLPAFLWLPPLIRWTRAKLTIPPGHCQSCGYDLRASPHRCPECGQMPSG